MTEKPGKNIQDGSNGVKIYSSNEKRIKFLGDVLANDASRSIFLLLAQGELPAGRIADKTGGRCLCAEEATRTGLLSRSTRV